MKNKKPDIQDLTEFLLDYASCMISAGTYSKRVNKCVTRIANSFGYDVALSIFLKTTTLTITSSNNPSERRTYIKKNKPRAIDFKRILGLSALSWQIYDDKFDLKEAKLHFKNILSQKRNKFVPTLFLISFGNAAFSKLFGGDLGTLLIVFCSTMVGFGIKTLMAKYKLNIRLQYIAVSFVVSSLASFGCKLELTKTQDVAIASSVLFLIPGVYFINSIIEILNENNLIATSRIINVSVLIICIAIGIFLSLSLSNAGLINA